MKRDHLLVALAVLIAFSVLFGTTLIRNDVFLFRDAAHFYYPESLHSRQAWAESLPRSEPPLWNTNEELGRPLAGDPTSALFYPAKLLFALPIRPASAYMLYIIGHVFWAAACAFVASRLLGCSVIASGLASVSYAFGGAIVFQYCNVIYLISASWLPLGLAFAWRSIIDLSWRWCFGAAVAEALMILGGDPQMAYYLAVLHAAGLVLWHAVRSRPNTPRKPIGYAALAVILTPALAGCLAAIQILPSVEWSRHSERREGVLASSSKTGEPDRWGKYFATPPAETHRSKSYEFSIPPWRWPELLMPNFGGDLFPKNHRWLTMLPASGRTWTPSLYMGLLPLFFALRRMWYSSEPLDRWLRSIAILGVVGSLGWYGLGWIANEVSVAAGGEPIMWGPVGGLYWLLNIVLPIHDQFRYPAKLWTLFACAMSLAAARELSGRRELLSLVEVSMLARCLPLLVGATVLIGAIAFWIAPSIEGRVTSELFGPLEGYGVAADISLSVFHVLATLTAVFATVKLIRNRGCQAAALILLTGCEIALAQSASIVSADRTAWETEPKLVSAIKRHAIEHGVSQFRVYRAVPNGAYPVEWSETSSPQRQVDGLRWDRATIAHRYGLTFGFDVLRPAASFSSQAFESFANDTKTGRIEKSRLDLANVFYIIGREKDLDEYSGLVQFAWEDLFGEPIVAAYNPDALPRTWIGRVAGESSEVVRSMADDESVQVTSYGMSEVTLLASISRNGTLVLGDVAYPGWRCHVTDTKSNKRWETAVLIVNGLFRGIELAPGNYSVSFEYQPASFRIGATVTVVTWIAICVGFTYWRVASVSGMADLMSRFGDSHGF